MTFMEFESLEDMIAWQQEQTARANAVLDPKQEALTWGDYWVRFHPDRLTIFGHALTLDEFRDRELASGGTEFEWETYTRPQAEASLANGFLYGDAYSVIEPDGEPGSTHRAHTWPIDAATFEQARAVGWDITTAIRGTPLGDALEQAYTEWRTWMLATQGQW